MPPCSITAADPRPLTIICPWQAAQDNSHSNLPSLRNPIASRNFIEEYGLTPKMKILKAQLEAQKKPWYQIEQQVHVLRNVEPSIPALSRIAALQPYTNGNGIDVVFLSLPCLLFKVSETAARLCERSCFVARERRSLHGEHCITYATSLWWRVFAYPLSPRFLSRTFLRYAVFRFLTPFLHCSDASLDL